MKPNSKELVTNIITSMNLKMQQRQRANEEQKRRRRARPMEKHKQNKVQPIGRRRQSCLCVPGRSITYRKGGWKDKNEIQRREKEIST